MDNNICFIAHHKNLNEILSSFQKLISFSILVSSEAPQKENYLMNFRK